MSASTGPPEPLLAFEPPSAPIAAALSRLDALQQRYATHRAAGRILPNTVEAIRVELTYHSNAIEGNTLSLRDTQLVVEGRSPAPGKPLREVYEARNHDRALRTIEQWAAQRAAATPLTERDLLEIHNLAMADIDAAAAGAFRSGRVLIAGTGFVPPGAQRFPELLPRLLGLANRDGPHAVLQAAELHYNLAAVHPFSDGNGRTARLMMNYHLLRHGFAHTIIEVTQRGGYLAALDEANAGRWERLALLVAAAAERALERLVDD